MPKNILITGANGQVGQELQALIGHKEHDLHDANFYFTDKDTLDITHKGEVEKFVETHAIDSIINCAAYTAVDAAEENESSAYSVNRDAVKILADLAFEKNMQLIHISTDYVYDSNKNTPLTEEDKTNPESIYASSKLAGEDEIRRIDSLNAFIIRTSWVYSSFGNNFVETMLRLGKSREELNVVCDQIGTPTYAKDLARAILKILHANVMLNRVTTYNYSNEGTCSWYDFAKAIFELSSIDCQVNPIGTEEYPTPAKRPHYSVLDKKKIKKDFDLDIPYWRDSLKECLGVIGLEIDK